MQRFSLQAAIKKSSILNPQSLILNPPPPSPAKNVFSKPDAIAGEGKGVRRSEKQNEKENGEETETEGE